MLTKMEIIFDKRLTEDEFDRLTEWIDNNITKDYCCFSKSLGDSEDINGGNEM